MKDDKEFIKGIYDKYDEYLKDSNNEKLKNKKSQDNFLKETFINSKIAKILSVAAVVAIAISGVWVNNNMINQNNEDIIGNDGKSSVARDNLSLKTVNDFENFYNIAKNNMNESEMDFKSAGVTEDFAVSANQKLDDISDASMEMNQQQSENSETVSSTEETTRTDDYSKTNTQVENVDEADIVKTNGKYIFYVVSNKLIIVDIQNKNVMQKVAEINYQKNEFMLSEIYINDNNLIVLGKEETYSYSNGETVRETTDAIYKKGIYKQHTVAIIYDITNIANPKETRRVKIEGNYISSRMIGRNIYFVSNKLINNSDIFKNNINDLDENIFKPTYTDTAYSSSEKTIGFDKIYYFDNIETLNYLTLGGFSLDDKSEVAIETFLGAGEDVYCSTENMYIIKSKYVYDVDTGTNLGKDTKIIKFSLNNGKIEFKAETDIAGGINNQFSIDENNGYLRIATTIGKTYNMDNSTSNSLYILDKDLKEVGRLDGIAKSEMIYSVRYVGNMAYVVTFKEVDPLFVIDLSDVTKPKILGELKIPGYSTYIHPYDETHLIGFGYDTKTNGTGVQNNGLKMAMFDVSNLENPKELFNVKIGDSSTNSPLINDHKALLFSKEKNFIAFPVVTYRDGKRKNIAQVYDIDLSKGFVLRGEINHEGTGNEYYGNYNYTIQRIIYSNNVFYTLSNKLIKASDMNSLQQLTKLDIN